MTLSDLGTIAPAKAPGRALAQGTALPVLTIVAALVLIWYAGTIWLNAPGVIDRYERDGRQDWSIGELVAATMAMERPLLPAPHQVLAELDKTVLEVAPTSRRSLVYHGWPSTRSRSAWFQASTG